MELIRFILGLLLIALEEIVKVFIKRPRISLLLIFGILVNSLPLPNEPISSDESIIQLGQIKS